MIRLEDSAIDQMIADGVTWPEAFLVVGGLLGVATILAVIFWGWSQML